MVTIILYGDIKDKSITSKLCRLLSDYGGVLYFSNSKAVKYGCDSNLSYCVYECDNLNEISIPDSIVIFKSKQSNTAPLKLCQNITAIIESHNKCAISAISGNSNTCVSCGMSSNDTITISSLSDTDATISIQRSIIDMHQNIIDPCEFTVKMQHFCDGYVLLSTVCVMILSDSNLLKKKLIL